MALITSLKYPVQTKSFLEKDTTIHVFQQTPMPLRYSIVQD